MNKMKHSKLHVGRHVMPHLRW